MKSEVKGNGDPGIPWRNQMEKLSSRILSFPLPTNLFILFLVPISQPTSRILTCFTELTISFSIGST